MNKSEIKTAWDKTPLTERLEIWRHAVLDLKENDDPELLRSFDFDELANDLSKAKKAIEERDWAANGEVATHFKKLSWGEKVAFMQKISDRLDERAKGK